MVGIDGKAFQEEVACGAYGGAEREVVGIVQERAGRHLLLWVYYSVDEVKVVREYLVDCQVVAYF